ncbi:MAG: U32 family peptidase [Firmicutes bacterium]|nr:U32 family peptidase [Bacillota bacterium]
MSHPELLSPAGNMECLKSAVAAGCNAVYFGGTRFNARHGASGFDIPAMREAVHYTRLHDVKTLLTVNTLVKETEWKDFTASMEQMAETGIDGVIVQDLGVADHIRKQYPWIALHGSTQMSVHSPDGVRFLEDLGFQRVVLARELSLEDVRKIRESTKIELEVFIHGAMCYSVSGQCLMSSFIGGRSGNRGMCAQPCRLAYQAADRRPAYLMDMKDMCTLDILPEIVSCGVDSLKIEGRLKSPEYVFGVTSGYRAALDHVLSDDVLAERKQEMAQLFNRGGFSRGYWVRSKDSMIEAESPKHQGLKIGKVSEIRGNRIYISSDTLMHAQDVLEIRTERPPFPSYQLQERNLTEDGKSAWITLDRKVRKGQEVYRLIDSALLRRFSDQEEPKRPIVLSAEFIEGRNARLTASCNETCVTVEGSRVETALERSMEEEMIRRSLMKTGGTPFIPEEIRIRIEGSIFVPVSALNDLRRRALTALEDALCQRVKRPYGPLQHGSWQGTEDGRARLEAVLSSEEQWKAAKAQKVGHVWFREEKFSRQRILELINEARIEGISCGVSLPYFDLRNTWQLKDLWDVPVLVHGLGQMAAYPAELVSCDMQIPVMNRNASDLIHGTAASLTLSVESSSEELSLIGENRDAVIAYGKIPVMTTRQCLQKESLTCTHGSGSRILEIRDRKDEPWTAELHCGKDCYNMLYTGHPLWMADRSKALKKTGAGIWRLMFLDEDAAETEFVLKAYQKAAEGRPVQEAPEHSIRGHFFKPCL